MYLLKLVLYVALLIALCYAQEGNTTKIYTDDEGITLAVEPSGSTSKCWAGLFILRNSPTDCLLLADFTYTNITNLGCAPELVGATSLSCTAVECFALNPTQNLVVVLNNTGAVIDTLSLNDIVAAPSVFSAYHLFPEENITMLVMDASNNSIWMITIDYTDPLAVMVYYELLPIVPIGVPAGISLYSIYSFYYASVGDTSVSVYDIFGGVYPLGTFENVVLINSGANGNLLVEDAACGCVYSQTSEGNLLYTIPLPKDQGVSAPAWISSSRNKFIVADKAGVYVHTFEWKVSYTTTPVTCFGVPGRITATIENGDYPINVFSYPDYSKYTLNEPSGVVPLPIATVPIQGYPITLMDDYQGRAMLLYGSLAVNRRRWVGPEVITPAKGNSSYEFRMLPFSTFVASCNPVTCININQFEWFEFYLNIGEGGQDVTLTLNPSYVNLTQPYELRKNTWVHYKLHLPTIVAKQGNFQGIFTSLQFEDRSGNANQNPMYLDAITLTPYKEDFPTRQLYVWDACWAPRQFVVPFEYKPFTVEVVTEPVSCHTATTISSNLATDGTLFANLTNGVGPFKYNWGYNKSGISNESKLTGYESMTSFITVYDNMLNSSWNDISIAKYNMNDTKYFRSPPSSISFTPTEEGNAIMFQTFSEILISDFPTIEFWVNGGDEGGQTLGVFLLRTVQTTGQALATGNIVARAAGLNILPAKKWVKGVFNLVSNPTPGVAAPKYNLIEFVNSIPTAVNNPTFSPVQSTVYIDDIVLLGKNVISVTDKTGCAAVTNRARVNTPPRLTQSVGVNNAKCWNRTDGSVYVTMGGGTPTYTYSWSGYPSVTGPTLSDLGEGIFYVEVQDANECAFKSYAATVLQPPPITVMVDVIQPKCYGRTGTVSATANGGSGSYTYQWASPTGLPQHNETIPTPSPDPIFLDSLVAQFGSSNTKIICNGTGSHIPNSPGSPTHSGYCSLAILGDGLKSTINGCVTCLSLSKYSKVMFWIYSSDVDAFSGLMIALSQETTQSDPVALTDLADLQANVWTQVTVNLSSTAFAKTSAPDSIVFFSATPKSATILLDDIVIVPIIENGVGFSTLSGFQSKAQVSAANYFITIVDSNGCSSFNEVKVVAPQDITIVPIVTGLSSSAAADASIKVNVSGGTPPYAYSWKDINVTTSTIQNLKYGEYVISVTDANGCSKEMSVYVNPYAGPIIRTIKPYNAGLSSGLAALVAVGMLICLFSGTMLYKYWASFSILGSFLSSMMILGCVLAFLSALVLLPAPTDQLCISFIWLLGVGFVLVYGCLFIKTWALYKVWRNAIHYHKANLTPLYIIKCLCMAVFVEVVFLVIWTAIDPPRVRLVSTINNSLEHQCETKHITFWIIFLAGKGAWLIFGAVLSVLTKNIAKEYNESGSIAYAIYNNVLLGAIAIPLAALLSEIPGGRLTVEVVIICIAFSFTLVVVFFKVWHRIILPDKIPMATVEMRSKRHTTTGTTSGGSYKSSKESKESKESRDSRGPHGTISAAASSHIDLNVDGTELSDPDSPNVVAV